MLTLASNDFMKRYVQESDPVMRADLLEVVDMMALIAPEAELVSNVGIPCFQLNGSWLYGVAARSDHLSERDLFIRRPLTSRSIWG